MLLALTLLIELKLEWIWFKLGFKFGEPKLKLLKENELEGGGEYNKVGKGDKWLMLLLLLLLLLTINGLIVGVKLDCCCCCCCCGVLLLLLLFCNWAEKLLLLLFRRWDAG